ncbi:MAG TPA: FecR domain-containing protein [Chitinophagaceae bacterium]|nr:FecR domain-containing protein [Chitinophagaceae bacterium]
MSQNEAIELLDKYLKGQASEEESRQVESWLERINKENNEWKAFSDADRKAYIQALYEDLQRKIAGHSVKRSHLKFWQWAAAAVIFLAATFGTLYMTVFKGEQSSQVISVQDYTSLSTGVGEMKEITLKDGTKVWLNAMSELRYPPSFQGDTRELYIKGEAFFDVAQDQQHPFIVHSGALKTKVLGTSFNVSAYPDEEEIEIAVLSGKIAVSREEVKSSKKVELVQNEKVSYTKASETIDKSHVAHAENYDAWRKGEMVFYHTPMKEVVEVLQRNYGLQFQFETEAMKEVEISGTFDKKQQSKIVLKAICLSMGGQFKKEGIHITIGK